MLRRARDRRVADVVLDAAARRRRARGCARLDRRSPPPRARRPEGRWPASRGARRRSPRRRGARGGAAGGSARSARSCGFVHGLELSDGGRSREAAGRVARRPADRAKRVVASRQTGPLAKRVDEGEATGGGMRKAIVSERRGIALALLSSRGLRRRGRRPRRRRASPSAVRRRRRCVETRPPPPGAQAWSGSRATGTGRGCSTHGSPATGRGAPRAPAGGLRATRSATASTSTSPAAGRSRPERPTTCRRAPRALWSRRPRARRSLARARRRTAAAARQVVLHEPIPPDARGGPRDARRARRRSARPPSDAERRRRGARSARPPTSSTDAAYGATRRRATLPARTATRSARRSAHYDEPFTPSTAPFKRLEAFDAVRERLPRSTCAIRASCPAALQAAPRRAPTTSAFYADLVVDVAPDGSVRIPSVGPGRAHRARAARRRARTTSRSASCATAPTTGSSHGRRREPRARPRARRLVMELAIARAAFGGQHGRPELERPAARPSAARQRRARRRRGARRHRREPRAAPARGRRASSCSTSAGFADSDEPPHGRGSVYLDLALSKKGVCRHRAFAFLVTAQSLGIPTRLVENEAHAWVEVHDGTLWRRIDLGGAGPHDQPRVERARASAPCTSRRPTPSRGPQSAERGRRHGLRRAARDAAATASSAPGRRVLRRAAPSARRRAPAHRRPTARRHDVRGDRDDRPRRSSPSLDDADAHRGLPLHVRGEVRADGEPCAHVAVELSLREPPSRHAKRPASGRWRPATTGRSTGAHRGPRGDAARRLRARRAETPGRRTLRASGTN